MRGLLIYDAAGKVRNEWFIARLTESAQELGCELELLIYKCEKDKERISGYDFAIVRTINPELNEYIENLGIPCFNNAKTSFIANDKWETYLFAKALGIPVMSTIKSDTYDDAKRMLGIPFVLKSVGGHGGSEVFLVDNEDKCKELFSKYRENKLIAQELCSEPGVDMRVYVLDGKVLAAAKRTSLSDFRSNFSLGGNAEIVNVPAEVEKMALTVADRLSADLIGVDFIRHSGEWVLNEIEDVVGTRMLYSLGTLDPARLYVGHVVRKMKNSTDGEM